MNHRLTNHYCIRRLAWGIAILCGLSWPVFAADKAADTRAGKGIAYPVYGAVAATPIAVVRVASTRTEYQRRGFLRIGALPILVAEGVRLEVRDPLATAQFLARLPEWLRAPGKGRAGELRDFQMFDRAEPDRPWLVAGRVCFAAGGQWELQAGEVREPGRAPQPFTQARLQVSGDRTGEVMLADGRTLKLFPQAQTTSTGGRILRAGSEVAAVQPTIAQPDLETRTNLNQTAP